MLALDENYFNLSILLIGFKWFFIPSGIWKRAGIKVRSAYCDCLLPLQDYLPSVGDPERDGTETKPGPNGQNRSGGPVLVRGQMVRGPQLKSTSDS